MDIKTIVEKMRARGDEPRDVKERYDEDGYGPMERGDTDDGSWCPFIVGFTPEVGDILVFKNQDPVLVGDVNALGGRCHCCGSFFDKSYDDYVGYYPVSYWGPFLYA